MLSFDDFPGQKPATSPENERNCGPDLSAGFGMAASNIQFHGGGLGETTTLDLFPLLSIKSINVAEMDQQQQQAVSHPEVVAEPLSIIYKGEIHVLDVPEVKAKQILEFANRSVLPDFRRRYNVKPGSVSVMEPMSTIYQGEVNVLIDVPAAKGKEILDFARVSAPKGHYKCLSSKPSNNPILSSPEPLHANYLHMERRYWMQRFVQRRKERITGKAPYQMESSSCALLNPLRAD